MAVVARFFPYHWLILGGLFTAVFIVCWRVVRYYSDPGSRHSVSTLVINLTVICALCSIILIPVDIFTTANDVHIVEITQLYALVYLGLAASALVLSPFAYFWVEEADSGEEDCSSKMSSACKSTFVVLLMLSILLGTVLIIGERESSHVTTKEAANLWIQALADDHQRTARAYQALLWVVAAFTAIGFINLVFYGGFGLASLPVVLIRGHLGAEEEKLEWEFSRLKLRQEKQKLVKRFGRSTKGKERIAQVEHKIKIAEKRMHQLEKQTGSGCYSYIATVIAPFRLGIGLGLMITSILVVGTIGVVCLDRFVHSECGFSCGYMVDGHTKGMPNLIDMLMVKLSEFFPLDYVVFLAIGLYLLLACAHGVGRMGIRFMGIEIFRIRRGKTAAQALLIGAGIVAVSALAVSVTLLSIAPQYVTFGHQTYIPKDGNGQRTACEMGGIVGGEGETCRLTQFSRFVGTQKLNNRLFSLAFFFGQATFVGVSMVSLLHAFCRRKDGEFEADDLSDDDGEEMEGMGGMGALGDELRSLTEQDA